ncbi:WD40 repeat protein [Giardia muris]|uniref:WD40 repeat protein n=1 Tax=Giardia muris TaxID=5742 RepID=A0A4Z1SQL5_GIAMU|nr:WD40 repeat protein [Giardia muris]|eukprot:TNJ28116.1 WD40 repeat protein [Giardia muris]
MLSTAFLFKRILFSESGEAATHLAWNKYDRHLVAGGSAGTIRLMLIEVVVGEAKSRRLQVTFDKKLELHGNNAITTLSWNENDSRFTSGDIHGDVIVSGFADGRWTKDVINSPGKLPVVSAIWSPDSSKLLMVYENGAIVLGTASGHKIYSGTLKQQSAPRFAFISDTRLDQFIVGWDYLIRCYDYDGKERWKLTPPPSATAPDSFVYGCWGQVDQMHQAQALSPTRQFMSENFTVFSEGSQAPMDPSLIVVTTNGVLCVYHAATGTLLGSTQMHIVPKYVQVAPSGHFVAVSGHVHSADSSIGLKSLLHTLKATKDSLQKDMTAVVLLYRLSDLELAAAVRVPEVVATSCVWDDSSLQFAIAAGSSIYIGNLRPSYRQLLMPDGTIVFTVGGSLVKNTCLASSLHTSQANERHELIEAEVRRGDETLVFWKPGLQTPHQRWPSDLIGIVGCGMYVGVLTASGTLEKKRTQISFYSSVGAPAFSAELAYVPYYYAGSSLYMVCASNSRVSILDIRYLSGEASTQSRYHPIYEWHVDLQPDAEDRELHVARLTVKNPVVAVAISDSRLFIARDTEQIYCYDLPSIELSETIAGNSSIQTMYSNCAGTILGCIHTDGSLVFYYTKRYYSEELFNKYAPLPQKNQTTTEVKAPKVTNTKQSNTAAAALGFDDGEDATIDGTAVQSVLPLLIKPETTEPRNAKKCIVPPYEMAMADVWGLVFSGTDPSLAAVATRHKIIVIHLDTQNNEDAIFSSAHLLGFSDLYLITAYLDDYAHGICGAEGAYQQLETQRLRELAEAMYGPGRSLQRGRQGVSIANDGCLDTNLIALTSTKKQTTPVPRQIAVRPTKDAPVETVIDYDDPHEGRDANSTIDLPSAVAYAQKHPSVHLYRIVAEASLLALDLEVASYFYIRAGDYVSYHFCESISQLGSEEQKKAEVLSFLGDFSASENIYQKVLGRPDLVIRSQKDLQMWSRILVEAQQSAVPGKTLLVDDNLLAEANRAKGRYYERHQQYTEAIHHLKHSGDKNLYIDALFAGGRYSELRKLALGLPEEESVRKVALVLARLGDVEGAVDALLRAGDPRRAILVCTQLKRLDLAVDIATERNMLGMIQKDLSNYLRQLLDAQDDRAALDLLRRTSCGEMAASIIINVAERDLEILFSERRFPLIPGAFHRIRRIIVLAGKEAAYVQRQAAKKEFVMSMAPDDQLLTGKATEVALNNFLKESDDEGAKKTQPDSARETIEATVGNISADLGVIATRTRPLSMIWRLARQTRLIVLSSYMLHIGNPDRAIWPALEASDYYRSQNGVVCTDICSQYLSRIALPIGIQALLLTGDYQLASNLLEIMEADSSLTPAERDQLEQLAVDLFSRVDIEADSATPCEGATLTCARCSKVLSPYCGTCSCGWEAPICMRTGHPIKLAHMDRTKRCSTCGSLSTLGKAELAVCPLCHEPYAN